MTEETTPSAVPRKEPHPLHVAWRAASGLASLGLGVFGGLAVFRTENEAGSATMLVVAALFGIVALLGRVPRMKFGDNEIDPSVPFASGAAFAAEQAAQRAKVAARHAEDAPAARAAVEATSDVADMWRRVAEATKAKAAGVSLPSSDWYGEGQALWRVAGSDDPKPDVPKQT